MAQTPFSYNGQQYTVDEVGIVRDGAGTPLGPNAADIGLWQAAALATNDPSAAAAAGPAIPSAAPRADASPYGQVGEPSVNGVGTGAASSAAPAPAPAAPPTTAAPTIPTTPPRTGPGSATELRAERDRVQKQIDEIMAIKADDRTNAQNTLLGSLNTRMTTLTADITKSETPAAKPATTMRGTGGTTEPFVIIDNGDGTITAAPNPNHTGQVTPQVVSHGNKTFVITPPTAAELKADPAAPPHTTVAYTDTDAQQIANRTTAVAESNARVAAAQQAVNAFTARSQAEIADRVSKGEDAASVRADLAQQLTAIHQTWVEADGDARRAQQALDSYNVDRHNVAAETLQQSQIEATAKAQAAQDATTRRGQDIAAGSNKYATDAASQSARLNAANSFIQHSLTTLNEINKTLPPGSDLAGKALEGLIKYGMQTMQATSAPQAAPPSTDSALPATDVTKPLEVAPVGYNPNDIQWNQPPGGAPDATNAPPPPSPPTLDNGVAAGPMGGLNWLTSSPASPMANPANVPPAPPSLIPDQAATTASLAAANAAAHQQTMALPMGKVAPDGTPYAGPQDVARIFGRGGNA